MKFTIQRSKWLRGEGGKESRLLRPTDGKMCCIGQACTQLGVNRLSLEGWRTVDDVIRQGIEGEGFSSVSAALCEGGRVEADWLYAAYITNDDPDLSDDVREKQLAGIAAMHGHEFVFVD